MKRLSHVLIAVLIITTPARAAYHALQIVGWGELSNGVPFLQLRLTVVLAEGERWRGSSCDLQTQGGQPITFYQFPSNDTNPPNQLLFSIYPDSQYTSFYTAPHLWPNTTSNFQYVDVVQSTESADHLSAEWYAASPTVGPGEFVIAQFTLLGGPGEYSLSVSSVLKPAPTITGNGGFCTCHVPGGVLAPQSISFGPWDLGVNSTSALIPRDGWIDYHNAVIEGVHAADFSVEELPSPDDIYDVKFHPTDYGFRSATLVLTGTYQDPWTPEPVPWSSHIPLTGYGMCFGDFNGNGRKDLADLANLLANYGMSGWDLDYFDGNLVEEGGFEYINIQDLAAWLGAFYDPCEL